MSRAVESVIRRVMCELLVPTLVVALWICARFSGGGIHDMQTTWREGPTVRIGNPYTAPVAGIVIESQPADTPTAAVDFDGVQGMAD